LQQICFFGGKERSILKNLWGPSSKTTLHFGPAITKVEPHFFGQHKLTKNSSGTWKMKIPNMQIRCEGRIGSGF